MCHGSVRALYMCYRAISDGVISRVVLSYPGTCSEVIHRNQVSVRILGDVSMLPDALQHVLGKVVTMSAHYSKYVGKGSYLDSPAIALMEHSRACV
jgi:hypothetical protein